MIWPDDYINKVICGDCLEVMKGIPDNSVDLVVTDPPYNASISNLHWEEKYYKSINEEWDKKISLEFLDIAWQKLIRTGSMLVFCSKHLLNKYLTWRQPQQIIHWQKTNPFPAITKVYPFSVEYILWFAKGSPYKFNKEYAKSDVFSHPFCSGTERHEHPSQKPLYVLKSLIRIHSNLNDIVLDCFLGSGTTAVACKQLGRQFIGIEINPDYCKIAEERLKQEVLPFPKEEKKPEQQELSKWK